MHFDREIGARRQDASPAFEHQTLRAFDVYRDEARHPVLLDEIVECYRDDLHTTAGTGSVVQLAVQTVIEDGGSGSIRHGRFHYVNLVHCVQLAILSRRRGVVGVRLDGDDEPRGSDFATEHQCDDTLMRTDVEHVSAWTQCVASQRGDFRQLYPVVVVPAFGKGIGKMDAQSSASIRVFDGAAGKIRDKPADVPRSHTACDGRWQEPQESTCDRTHGALPDAQPRIVFQIASMPVRSVADSAITMSYRAPRERNVCARSD